MRILHVTQAYFPFNARGGPAIKVRSIARALKKQGNEVVVLTADLGFGPDEIAAAKSMELRQAWHSEVDGFEATYLKTRGHYRNLTVNPAVLGFCRSRIEEFDLVHIYGLYDTLGPAVAHYCHRFRVPYVLEPLGMTLPIDRGFLLKKIWRTVMKRYLGQASRWIATSEIERQDLRAVGIPDHKVVLRFNGIDRENFSSLPAPGTFRKKLGLASDDKVILFLGRLIPRKGADLLIEALARIGNPQTKLVIAGPDGEGGYIDLLRQKANALGIQHRVLFLGPLYGEAQKEAYVDATVFALPSRYENFGNTAAEAIACGTPVIVSDRCGIAPLIEGRAGLVTAYETQALTQTLTDLLTNFPLYERLKSGCRDVAEKIFWDGLVREMRDLYRQTCAEFLKSRQQTVPA